MKNWCLEVWGDYACFTRPEMKVERVSYDIITPSSARAIFESILWKPAIKWHITKIEVINPIKWTNVRRNEVSEICSSPSKQMLEGKDKTKLYIDSTAKRQQRAALILKDVKYRIHGYFDFIPPTERTNIKEEIYADESERCEIQRLDETEAKYAAMFERRARKGQCFHRPYLGCREFACSFRLVDLTSEQSKALQLTQDLGWMLYDMVYEDKNRPMPSFFRARLDNGVVITDERIIEVLK